MTLPSAITHTVPGIPATLTARLTTVPYLCVRIILAITYDGMGCPVQKCEYLTNRVPADAMRTGAPSSGVRPKRPAARYVCDMSLRAGNHTGFIA